uniref:Pre-mRNA-splicing factor prp46 n=1 Tax=Fibrocapsa japonica TaxID=94617 RepID=A0A7S2V5E3_9STRA
MATATAENRVEPESKVAEPSESGQLSSINTLVLKSMKRTFDMFIGSAGQPIPEFLPSHRLKISCKMNAEYAPVIGVNQGQDSNGPVDEGKGNKKSSGSQVDKILLSIEQEKREKTKQQQISTALTVAAANKQRAAGNDYQFQTPLPPASRQGAGSGGSAPAHKAGGGGDGGSGKLVLATTSAGTLTKRRGGTTKVPRPEWHAPWRLQAVISGHLGWVRSIAFDPSNEWYVTGSADRTIKIWDLAKCSAGAEGGLKLTLTGHINCVRGLAVSPRHPYLFSAGEDKLVKCWDLEYNKVVRHYHGHLSGVYDLKMHPTLDILITAGRDSVARVWDIRTKQQVHVLSGHENTVGTIAVNAVDPQVITGSHDCTIKLWDLAAGRSLTTLTHHKKAVRAVVTHPKEFSFVSAAADNLKKWQCKDGVFLKNLSGHNTIINCAAVNEDGVLVSGGDNGSLCLWDYATGYQFQKIDSVVQPGSLDCEAGIFAACFDVTGSRLITCEADKTVKIWKEDPEASEESHPIDMKSWTRQCLAPKRY